MSLLEFYNLLCMQCHLIKQHANGDLIFERDHGLQVIEGMIEGRDPAYGGCAMQPV